MSTSPTVKSGFFLDFLSDVTFSQESTLQTLLIAHYSTRGVNVSNSFTFLTSDLIIMKNVIGIEYIERKCYIWNSVLVFIIFYIVWLEHIDNIGITIPHFAGYFRILQAIDFRNFKTHLSDFNHQEFSNSKIWKKKKELRNRLQNHKCGSIM